MARRCSLLLLVFSFVLGCGDRVEPAGSDQESDLEEISEGAPDAGASQDVGPLEEDGAGESGGSLGDASEAVPDDVSDEDGIAEPDTVDAGSLTEEVDVEEETEPPPADPEWDPVFEGQTIDTTVIFYPEALEGVFLFGLSAEFGSALTQLGNTAAGVIMIPVVVDLHHGKAGFRVVDPDTGEVEPGDEGLVESYPYFIDQEDRVHINFANPLTPLSVQLYQNCTYDLTGYQLMEDPEYFDGMVTWGALEHYESDNCWQGGVPESFGLNFHLLRRLDANPGFVGREVDPDSPFGFFQVPVQGGPNLLTRLPFVGPEFADGQVVYHISDSFPDELRPAIFDVAEDWNDSIEEAAGNRPFLIQEDLGDVMPWHPRYRVIHWDGASTDGAVAPFFESPVTGEMISTYVIFWLGDFQSIVDKYLKYLNDNPDVPWMEFESSISQPFPGWSEEEDLPAGVLRRREVERRPFRMSEIAAWVDRTKMELSGDELAQYIIADFLSHELGHNLGLRHNFKGSLDLFQQEGDEPSSTVMDYILGMPAPGSYDRGAMRYAYGDGVFDEAFAYCTDEDLALDPGCAQYDVGHPVSYFLGLLDKLSEKYPPGTPEGELNETSQQQEWNKIFLRVRQFVNSEYEVLIPEEPILAFEGLLSRVLCADSCETHPWFRSRWSLYLLYTKHIVQDMWNPNGEGEWHDLPSYTETQAGVLMTSYYELILDPDQPFGLKETIINKLPTSNVPGAAGLLEDLEAALSAVEEPTDEEAELLTLVQNAE